MGAAARRSLGRRTTPGDRLDLGLQLAQAAIDAERRKLDLPVGISPEDAARRLRHALRARNAAP